MFCMNIHILFNSMGSWYMYLSDYRGGRCLWKFNSMGGGVKIKVPSSPSRYFFSGIALTQTQISKDSHHLTLTLVRL